MNSKSNHLTAGSKAAILIALTTSVAEKKSVFIGETVGVSQSIHCQERHGSSSSLESVAIRSKFSALADRWESETGSMSILSQKLTHRDFLKIVSLGEDVVPFILERLPKRPHNWFLALDVLVDNADKPSIDIPNAREAVLRWIEWGKGHGRISEA